MKINNMSSAIRTTRENDPRITFLGRWIRKYKLDEIIQLWNVIINDMSIIGPRPNVEEEIKFYKNNDFDLFKYKPGITDYASIWFINLESRLSSDIKIDVNKEYLLRIKPLKNYLALKTVKNLGIIKYLYICFLTAIAFFNLKFAKKLILQKYKKKMIFRNLNETITLFQYFNIGFFLLIFTYALITINKQKVIFYILVFFYCLKL